MKIELQQKFRHDTLNGKPVWRGRMGLKPDFMWTPNLVFKNNLPAVHTWL